MTTGVLLLAVVSKESVVLAVEFVTLLPSAALRIVPVLCGAALVLDGLSELYIALRMGETEEPKA